MPHAVDGETGLLQAIRGRFRVLVEERKQKVHGVHLVVADLVSFAVRIVQEKAGRRPHRNRPAGFADGRSTGDGRPFELLNVSAEIDQCPMRRVARQDNDRIQYMRRFDLFGARLGSKALRHFERFAGRRCQRNVTCPGRWAAQGFTVPMRIRSRPSICPSNQAANCSCDGCCSLTSSSISSWMWVSSFRNSLSSIPHLLPGCVIAAAGWGKL